MKGISPYVDTAATLALTRAKLKHETENDSEEPAPDLGDNQACPEGNTPLICKALHRSKKNQKVAYNNLRQHKAPAQANPHWRRRHGYL